MAIINLRSFVITVMLCVIRFQNAKRNIALCEISKALSNVTLSLPPSAKKTSGDMDCKCILFCKQQSKYICATDFFSNSKWDLNKICSL